jgi:hypothetical protein
MIKSTTKFTSLEERSLRYEIPCKNYALLNTSGAAAAYNQPVNNESQKWQEGNRWKWQESFRRTCQEISIEVIKKFENWVNEFKNESVELQQLVK